MQFHNIRRNLPTFGVFLLPLVLVKITAVMLGGPATSSASMLNPVAVAEVSTIANADDAEWTPAQLAAARYVQETRGKRIMSNPLLYTGGAMVIVESTDDGKIATDLRLQGIMRSESGNTALINGKLYAEAGMVSDTTWIVQEINGLERSVVLKDQHSDMAIVLKVHLPGGD